MGRCIVEQLHLVPRAGNDCVIADDDGAHGHFIGLVGLDRLPDSILHEIFVSHELAGRESRRVHSSG